ncbi:hypothetical protein KP509_28G069900 [Ceratopteris richardii]|nr:hypothetical protein KP509_28G069900 [Ceratopteris richardii]
MYAKCGELVKANLLLDGLSNRDVFAWNALIGGYAQQGRGEEALKLYELMQSDSIPPDEVTFTCLLKASGSIGAVVRGEEVHDEIVRRGLFGKDIVLGNALVDMYAKCGILSKAQEIFDELPSTNVVSWNALIGGYAQHGHGKEALSCFEAMQSRGISPDAVTFACALKACSSIQAIKKGEEIHDAISKQGLLHKDAVLGNVLMDMYAKCGVFIKARKVFLELTVQSIISWNTLIAGYAQHGKGEEALACFEEMQDKGITPNAITFTCALKACTTVGALDRGQDLHDEISRQGLLHNSLALGNALIEMYSKCGVVAKAQAILDELPTRNLGSWNALITGYSQFGPDEDVLKCFNKMQCEGLEPSVLTFLCVLKSCARLGALDKGNEIYDEIMRRGLLDKDYVEFNQCLGNALVDMYAKCGALAKAMHIISELPVGDVVSWNAIIGGYSQQGQGESALECFELMQRKGIVPDAVTYTYIFKACGNIGALDKGTEIHNEIMEQRILEKDIVLRNAVVDMYSKCGATSKARQVLEAVPLQDVVSWNALLGGYAQQGHGRGALDCFESMQNSGIAPNAITFSCVLAACSHSGLLEEGQMCFLDMCTNYRIVPDLEHYTCIVDLFARAGHINKAVAMIEKMPSSTYPTVWAALLGACRKWGDMNIARWAFLHAIEISAGDAPLYVCMYNIYTARDTQEDTKSYLENLMYSSSCKSKIFSSQYSPTLFEFRDESLACPKPYYWNASLAGYSI